jgi:hypothetical protein
MAIFVHERRMACGGGHHNWTEELADKIVFGHQNLAAFGSIRPSIQSVKSLLNFSLEWGSREGPSGLFSLSFQLARGEPFKIPALRYTDSGTFALGRMWASEAGPMGISSFNGQLLSMTTTPKVVGKARHA